MPLVLSSSSTNVAKIFTLLSAGQLQKLVGFEFCYLTETEIRWKRKKVFGWCCGLRRKVSNNQELAEKLKFWGKHNSCNIFNNHIDFLFVQVIFSV